jgi:hypothetical protein
VVSPSPADRSLSQVNAINPLVAFYVVNGRKGEVLFYYVVPYTTRDMLSSCSDENSAIVFTTA